jgi:cell wall-associated NlpC family hydrolase
MSLGSIAPQLGMTSHAAAATKNQRIDHSGYRVKFSGPVEELIGDLLHSERGDPHQESETPHHEWYSEHTRRRLGAWGPRARLYAPLEGLAAQPLEWKRERVIATAERFIGYGYQHHHIPDWDPPADWPWKKTCVGHNGRGFDCSNFTGFVYNQGFGIKISSDVHRQASTDHAFVNERPLPVHRVELPADYAARQQVLKTGDLLYIRGREDGPITHVVLWIGPIGQAASGVPLIMDSHGAGVDDDEGRPIPCGVHLRPFREKSWYNRCASHAHRVFHDGKA